jgi:hypothetical protein
MTKNFADLDNNVLDRQSPDCPDELTLNGGAEL